MSIRVVAAEDSFLAREGIVSILGDIEDVELVEMSGDLDELRDAVERTSPDIVLTDIRMPPTNTDEGIRFAAELREQHPEMGVVVLSQHAEPRYAMALFNCGLGPPRVPAQGAAARQERAEPGAARRGRGPLTRGLPGRRQARLRTPARTTRS